MLRLTNLANRGVLAILLGGMPALIVGGVFELTIPESPPELKPTAFGHPPFMYIAIFFYVGFFVLLMRIPLQQALGCTRSLDITLWVLVVGGANGCVVYFSNIMFLVGSLGLLPAMLYHGMVISKLREDEWDQ